MRLGPDNNSPAAAHHQHQVLETWLQMCHHAPLLPARPPRLQNHAQSTNTVNLDAMILRGECMHAAQAPLVCPLSLLLAYASILQLTFLLDPGPPPLKMALLSSTSLRTCARPSAAPRSAVVSPRVVICRAKTQEDAIKMAQDLLQKGVEAAKNVDVNQVCCPKHSCLLSVVAKRCIGYQQSPALASVPLCCFRGVSYWNTTVRDLAPAQTCMPACMPAARPSAQVMVQVQTHSV